MKTLKEFTNENLNVKELLTTEEFSSVVGGADICWGGACTLGSCFGGDCTMGQCTMGQCNTSQFPEK